MGSTSPKYRFLGLFFDFQRLQTQKRLKNEENPVEQSVPGYDPQVIAWQWPSLATIVYSNAVGRA